MKSVDIIKFVRELSEKYNLKINEKKTRVQKERIKKITGVLIKDGQVAVSNSQVKDIKKEIYYCKKFGLKAHLKARNIELISNYRGYMYGRVNFINMISNDIGKQLYRDLSEIDWD